MTRQHDMSFEEDVIDRLARIEERGRELPDRVAKLELHRSYLAGVMATFCAIASFLHFK